MERYANSKGPVGATRMTLVLKLQINSKQRLTVDKFHDCMCIICVDHDM